MKIVKRLAKEAFLYDYLNPGECLDGLEEVFKEGFEIGFKKAKEMVLQELDKEHLDYDQDGGLTDCRALLFWRIENLGEEDENV